MLTRTSLVIAALLLVSATIFLPRLAPAASAPRPLGPADPSVLRGRIIDTNGKPVPGVKITLYSGMGTRFLGQETMTDADGRYSFDPLETGGGLRDHFLPGLQLSHPELVSADGRDWWDIDVPFGKVVEQNFTLSRGGFIAGSLTFGSGAWGLGDFSLRFMSIDKQRTAYATTDHPGTFRSVPLFPGEYRVEWNSALPDNNLLATVRVEAGKTASVNLNCRFTITPVPAPAR